MTAAGCPVAPTSGPHPLRPWFQWLGLPGAIAQGCGACEGKQSTTEGRSTSTPDCYRPLTRTELFLVLRQLRRRFVVFCDDPWHRTVRQGPFDKRSADQPRAALLSDALSFLGLLSRQRTTPTDVLASVARPRAPFVSDGPHCPVTGPTNGRPVSREPMRDAREISVEIGAVAGRPAEYLGALLRASSTGPPASVHFADSVCRAQALLRADRPAHAHTQPGARRPGRSRSGRASGK